jgi:hypothetical protein
MKTYIEHIIPILDNYFQQHPNLQFMQDNTPGHKKKKIQEKIEKRKINKIF